MHSCAFSLVVNQVLCVLLAYSLIQAHLVLRRRQELNRSVWERSWELLSPTLEVVAVYYRQRFCLLTLAEYGRILLDVAEPVRGKLRDKLRRIEREQYSLLENARPPQPQPRSHLNPSCPEFAAAHPGGAGSLFSLMLPVRSIAHPTERPGPSSDPERAPRRKRSDTSPFLWGRRRLSPHPPSRASPTA